jgi:type II secretory pathway component PulF
VVVPLSLSQFLALYSWFLLAFILFILLLIARFYQRSSGRRTYFRLFALPVIAFGVATVRYAATDRITGDTLADLALGVAGICLMALLGVLYWHMIVHAGRHADRGSLGEDETPPSSPTSPRR